MSEKTEMDAGPFIKKNVCYKEYLLHEYAYEISQQFKKEAGDIHIPRILCYDPVLQILTLERISFMCVSDYYGEKNTDVTPELFAKVRKIIRFLHKHHIIYPDITGYNFVEEGNGKLWIVDFGHADFQTHKPNEFVERFVEDEEYNFWNPEFL